MAEETIEVSIESPASKTEYTPAELRKWLDNALRNNIRTSLMIWGPPGVGKSSVVKQATEDNKIGFIDVRISQLSPTDLRGLPVPNKDTKMSEWYPPEFLPREGRGVLFLDEFNMAPPAVQGIAQQLLLDRRVGSYEVPEGWFIWAAGNRKEDKATVFDMSLPLTNRFLHLDVISNLPSFLEYGYKIGVNPTILAFLQARPALLHNIEIGKKSHGWPSPRSWVAADSLYKANEPITPAVGPAVAQEFAAFLRYKEGLPDLEAIVQGRGDKEIFPEKIDVQYALMGALIERAIAIDKNPSDPTFEAKEMRQMPKVINAMAWLFKRAHESKRLEFSMLFMSNMQDALKKSNRGGIFLMLLNADPRTKPYAKGDAANNIPSLHQLLMRASMYNYDAMAKAQAESK